jgi:hypothetical protein
MTKIYLIIAALAIFTAQTMFAQSVPSDTNNTHHINSIVDAASR